MAFLSWLFGKRPQELTTQESVDERIPHDDNQMGDHDSGYITFYVDGLQKDFRKFSEVGESLNLWIPKVNPDKVYIYHRNGPGGCLGIVPSPYSSKIISHLLDLLDYEAVIEELTDSGCKIKCHLSSMEETKRRKKQGETRLRDELTKAYNPSRPMLITIKIKKRNAVKVGDKLSIQLNDLDSYVSDDNDNHPPTWRWHINFLDQTGTIIAVLDHDKNTIERILKAHFNSYLFDIEVRDTFPNTDYSEEKQRVNWTGYPIKVLITFFKQNTSASN